MLCLCLTRASGSVAATHVDWQQIKYEVASLTDMHKRFSKSVRIFTQGEDVYTGMDYEYIDGDANTDIKDTEVVHIQGNLNSSIFLNDLNELVIGGDVAKEANIYVSGISRIFIGGSLEGSIISSGSMEVTIKGNHYGVIEAGDPHTNIVVHGDFNGTLMPNNKDDGSLVSITVKGYTDIKTIKSIYSYKYTEINSAFYTSNVKPGIYHPIRPYGSYYIVTSERR